VVNPEGIYADCTIGEGGHAEKILEALDPSGRLLGLDLDGEVLKIAKERLKRFRERVLLFKAEYSELKRIVRELSIKGFDGILFDLGISSLQLDEHQRGFSYRLDGPLDMRMDPSQPFSALDIVNKSSGEELNQILREYGEERWAKRISQAILKQREKKRIETSLELAQLVKKCLPSIRLAHKSLARVFQAFRIAVNDELNRLQRGIKEAIELLQQKGRICVLSYHSLEDRVVKEIFRQSISLRLITKKPIRPGSEEVIYNPRARSAKLRVAEKI